MKAFAIKLENGKFATSVQTDTPLWFIQYERAIQESNYHKNPKIIEVELIRSPAAYNGYNIIEV